MSEIATPPPNTLQLPSYGASLNPNFRVPEFHPMEMPRPYVAPLGEIVGQALKAYDAERQYRDQAPAREAAKATNQAYLASIGQGNGGLAANEQPASLGDRAFSSLRHLFNGTLGQHENDEADAPAATRPLANVANPFFDPGRGSFQAGPNGAQWVPFHRDPAQDAKTNEDARRLRIGNDAAEAAAQARPITPIQVHDPTTGGVAPLSSSGGGAVTGPGASDLPADAGGATTNALFPGGSAPAGSGAGFTAKATGYHPVSADDPAYKMEGGNLDAQGRPIHTLDAFRRGEAPDVTVAVDKASPLFGKTGFSPDLNAPVKFTDTGSAFKGKGTSRVDVARDSAGGANADENNRPLRFTLGAAPAPADASPAPLHLPALAGALPPDGLDAPASRPLAFLPSPFTLGDNAPPAGTGGALANLSSDLSLPTATAGNASALANVPTASFDAGPAVSGAENPFPSRPAVAAPANGAPALATAAGPTVLDPAVYGYRHGFMRPGPNGAKYFEATQDGSGDTLSPYVTSPTQGSPVIDPATGKPVPGVLMVGNQIVRQPGGANAAAAGAMNLEDLSPEQRLQARALATDLFGKKAGADPGAVNLVADQLRAGKSREEIRGLAGQVSPMLGVAGKYNGDPQVKTYLNTVANYQTVKDIAEKPADKITKQDDLSLLFAYVKADNPTMGVTEGSFKVAAAQGTFGDQVQKMVNQLTNTNQTLTQQQREGFRDAALSKLLGQRETYSLARDRYQGIASYVGADPDVAMGADVKPFTEADVARIKGGAAPAVPAASPAIPAASTAAAAVRVNSQAEYDALPSGTVFEDSAGKKGRKR